MNNARANAALAWYLGQIKAEERLKKLEELEEFYDNLDTRDKEIENKSKSVSIKARKTRKGGNKNE